MEGLSRLSKKCRKCPFVDTCDHKQMEALAYLAEPSRPTAMDAAAPVLRETIDIYSPVTNDTISVYKDEFEKELHKSLGIPGYFMPLA